MKEIIVAIDGYVATGKGTTAKGVAKKLGYKYLDTGAMYRAVTLYALRHGFLQSSEDNLRKMLQDIELTFVYDPVSDHNNIFLNGLDVEKEIRHTTLSSMMQPIVTSPSVRSRLGRQQQQLGEQRGIVVDGRDMGTVVFPHAELKLFLVGEKHIRAQRRYDEMRARGRQVSLEDVMRDINQRDMVDYLGSDAINRKAYDAIELDTSALTIEEQIDKVYQMAIEIISS